MMYGKYVFFMVFNAYSKEMEIPIMLRRDPRPYEMGFMEEGRHNHEIVGFFMGTRGKRRPLGGA